MQTGEVGLQGGWEKVFKERNYHMRSPQNKVEPSGSRIRKKDRLVSFSKKEGRSQIWILNIIWSAMGTGEVFQAGMMLLKLYF